MQKTQKTMQDIRPALAAVRKMARWYGRIGLMDLDDLVQNSMIRLLKNSDLGSPVSGFLSKVVRSVAVDAHRDLAKEKRYIWQGQNDDFRIVCERAEAKGYSLSGSCLVSENDVEIDLMPRLKNVLTELSGPARQVLLLYSDGYSYEEIAQLTNTNIGTVRSRLHYARKKARHHLSELG